MRDFRKEFVGHIQAAARSRRPDEVFADCVRAMALALWSPIAPDSAEVEKDFAAIRGDYEEADFGHFLEAFAVLTDALEARREEFLGAIMERDLRATNQRNGQFLTPANVARMMGRIVAPQPGERGLVRFSDPCCGAGVLLIESAEGWIQSGTRQCDICIVAGDIDPLACDITFVQLSLLGYAACVKHEDALRAKQYSPPRYTIGWYLHNFPLRGIRA